MICEFYLFPVVHLFTKSASSNHSLLVCIQIIISLTEGKSSWVFWSLIFIFCTLFRRESFFKYVGNIYETISMRYEIKKYLQYQPTNIRFFQIKVVTFLSLLTLIVILIVVLIYSYSSAFKSCKWLIKSWIKKKILKRIKYRFPNYHWSRAFFTGIKG